MAQAHPKRRTLETIENNPPPPPTNASDDGSTMTSQSHSSSSTSGRPTSSGPPPRNLTSAFGPSTDSLSDSSVDSVEAAILTNHQTSFTNDEIVINDTSPTQSLTMSPIATTFEPTIAQLPTNQHPTTRVAFQDPTTSITQSPIPSLANDTVKPSHLDRATINDANQTMNQSLVMDVEAIPPPAQNPPPNQTLHNAPEETVTFNECDIH